MAHGRSTGRPLYKELRVGSGHQRSPYPCTLAAAAASQEEHPPPRAQWRLWQRVDLPAVQPPFSASPCKAGARQGLVASSLDGSVLFLNARAFSSALIISDKEFDSTRTSHELNEEKIRQNRIRIDQAITAENLKSREEEVAKREVAVSSKEVEVNKKKHPFKRLWDWVRGQNLGTYCIVVLGVVIVLALQDNEERPVDKALLVNILHVFKDIVLKGPIEIVEEARRRTHPELYVEDEGKKVQLTVAFEIDGVKVIIADVEVDESDAERLKAAQMVKLSTAKEGSCSSS